MFIFMMVACATDEMQEELVAQETEENVVDYQPDDIDTSFCQDEYALCGTIDLPADFRGETRNLAIALYDSIPPAGPPAYIVEEIEYPNMAAGYSYEIAVTPVLASGEYYIWFNLYMEGGGEWVPVNDVDYTGSTSTPVLFDGTPVEFKDISMELASGW